MRGSAISESIQEEDEEESAKEGDISEELVKMNKYRCPVYRNSVRAGNSNDQAKNFITTIDLDCREKPEFWILRGLAIILQSDD